ELAFDEHPEARDAYRVDQPAAHDRLVVAQRIRRAADELGADERAQQPVHALGGDSVGGIRRAVLGHRDTAPRSIARQRSRYLRRFSGRASLPLDVFTTQPRSTTRTSPSVTPICCVTARRSVRSTVSCWSVSDAASASQTRMMRSDPSAGSGTPN